MYGYVRENQKTFLLLLKQFITDTHKCLKHFKLRFYKCSSLSKILTNEMHGVSSDRFCISWFIKPRVPEIPLSNGDLCPAARLGRFRT